MARFLHPRTNPDRFIDGECQAKRIISRFGTVARLVAALHRSGNPREGTAVRRWMWTVEGGGTGGVVPDRSIPAVIAAAALLGVELTPDDWRVWPGEPRPRSTRRQPYIGWQPPAPPEPTVHPAADEVRALLRDVAKSLGAETARAILRACGADVWAMLEPSRYGEAYELARAVVRGERPELLAKKALDKLGSVA